MEELVFFSPENSGLDQNVKVNAVAFSASCVHFGAESHAGFVWNARKSLDLTK